MSQRRFTSGKLVAQDVSTSTEIIPAVSGATLSLKRVILSSIGAAILTIESNDGTDMLVIYLPANGNSGELNFEPGQISAVAGEAIKLDSNVSTGTTGYIEAWY